MAAKKKANKKHEKVDKEPKVKKVVLPKLSDEKILQAIPKSIGGNEAAASLLHPGPPNGPSGPTLHKALAEFMSHQNEKAGHKVIAFASDVPNTYALRRPSGIMQLDMDTGGGLPSGGLSYIGGPDNAGKTFLVLNYMLMHQKLYGPSSALAFGCVEGGFDFARALNMGLKIAVPDEIIDQWDRARALQGMPGYTKEEWAHFKEKTGEFVILRGSTGEELLDTTLAAIGSKIFGIVALDSISAVLPEADSEKDMGDEGKRAAQAGLVTKFIAHYLPLTTGLDGVNTTTTIFTSQVRANQDRANFPSSMQKYIKKWEATGAHSARHAKLIDISVWDGEKIKKTISGKDTTIGKATKYELMKGKAGTHDNITGEYPFYYQSWLPQGVDMQESVIITGMKRGVIIENKGMFSVINPTTGEFTDIHGIPGYDTFKRMMELDFDFELVVRRQVLASKGISCLYR